MRKLRHHLPYIFFLLAVTIFAWYLYQNAERYQQLANFGAGNISLHVSLVFSAVGLNGLINYVLYRGVGAQVDMNESIGLAAVNTMANQLPFAGGMIAKGVYLRRKHQLAYTLFLSATVGLYSLSVLANGLIGLSATGYWVLVRGRAIPWILLAGFAGMTTVILVFGLPLERITLRLRSEKWRRRLRQLVQGWQLFLSDPRLAIKLIVLQLILLFVFAGRLWLVFRMLSQEITFEQSLMFAAAAVLTHLISLSPGGLGVREGIVGSVASIVGFELGISVVAVGIDRLISTAIVLVAGSISSYVLTHRAILSSETSESSS